MNTGNIAQNDEAQQIRRISKGKTVARGINTIHSSIFSILTSITSKGAFYVNCAFNWVAGMALGGWLLALGSVCNDFSMKDYLHRLKAKEMHGNDKRLCITGLVLCAFNSLLCLMLCMFMFHEYSSDPNYYKVKVYDTMVKSLKDNQFDRDKDPNNHALVSRDIVSAIKSSSEAKIEAMQRKKYAPEHAIFEKTRLDKVTCTIFMCLCVFLNALISAWLEREEVTIDDLDENGDVIRKNHGVDSWFSRLFGRNKSKPVMVARSIQGKEVAA